MKHKSSKKLITDVESAVTTQYGGTTVLEEASLAGHGDYSGSNAAGSHSPVPMEEPDEPGPVEEDSSKLSRKANKQFSVALVAASASSAAWDPHEIARLVQLLTTTLGIAPSGKKFEKFMGKLIEPLSHTNLAMVLSCLADDGMHVSTRFKVHSLLLRSGRDNVNSLLKQLDHYLEEGILTLRDSETRKELYSSLLSQMSLNNEAYQRVMVNLCSHASSKRVAGQVLSVFTEHFFPEEAAVLIHDICTFEFFLDLEGTLKDLKQQLSDELKGLLETRLCELEHLDSEGEIIDSDEDENGNLKDFVASEDSNDDHSSAYSSNSQENDSHDEAIDEGSNSDTSKPRSIEKRTKTHPIAPKRGVHSLVDESAESDNGDANSEGSDADSCRDGGNDSEDDIRELPVQSNGIINKSSHNRTAVNGTDKSTADQTVSNSNKRRRKVLVDDSDDDKED